MELAKAAALLLVGFVLLIKGADYFVEGSSAVAKMLRVPTLIIGLTIVAMGTSLPELSVSITASINNSNALAVSNVIGSNIFNLMVVLGASAVITPIYVSGDVVRKDFPFSAACAVLLLVLGVLGMELGRLDGALLLVIFVGFILYQVFTALAARRAALSSEEEEAGGNVGPWLALLYVVGGAAAVRFGGDWVVTAAKTIASTFGLSENLIGLTIVAMGTSLPELVTSTVAAKKNELDMAVGNVVGSNVFNILMILGTASAVSPIGFIGENVIDIIVLLAFSLLVWIFCATRKKLDKLEGVLMLLAYCAFTVYICLR